MRWPAKPCCVGSPSACPCPWSWHRRWRRTSGCVPRSTRTSWTSLPPAWTRSRTPSTASWSTTGHRRSSPVTPTRPVTRPWTRRRRDMEPYTIVIPATGEWLNANRRRNMHWSKDRELTGLWRTAAGWAAKASDVPALGPTRVVAQLRVVARRRSRIDPANYAPTAKACVDGLVDAGIWPDDSADWVEGPDMRLGETAAKPADEALVLLLYGQPCCDGAHTRHGHREAA